MPQNYTQVVVVEGNSRLKGTKGVQQPNAIWELCVDPGFGGKNILKRHFGGQSEELEHGYDSRLCYRIIVNLLWCDNRIVIV